MAVNKVIYNGKTLIDITGDTVTADKLFKGATAHKADGTAIVGTYTESEEFIPTSITFGTNTITESNGSNSIVTTINSDGSITEKCTIEGKASTVSTVITVNSDGSITEKRTTDGVVKTIKTVFNSNGSISQTIS